MPAEWMVTAGVTLFAGPLFAAGLVLLGRKLLDQL